jgi:nucleoside 2-deoxyribosyltransferase
MVKKKIFLSGPMRGVPRKESLDWRLKAVKYLSAKFEVSHAFRMREKKETFTDSKAAVARDLNDIKNADVLLVCDTFVGSSMIGTSMEVFYAYEQKIPVIVFGNAHENDYWLNYHTHLRIKDLKTACDIINRMFS